MLSEWTNEFFTQDPFVTRSFYNLMSIPRATLISLGYTLFDYSPWRFTFCIYCKTNNCLFEWQHLLNRLCSIEEKSFSWQNFLCPRPVLQRLGAPHQVLCLSPLFHTTCAFRSFIMKSWTMMKSMKMRKDTRVSSRMPFFFLIMPTYWRLASIQKMTGI